MILLLVLWPGSPGYFAPDVTRAAQRGFERAGTLRYWFVKSFVPKLPF